MTNNEEDPVFKEHSFNENISDTKMIYTAIPNIVVNTLYKQKSGRGLLATYHLLASHYSPDAIHTGIFKTYQNLANMCPIQMRQIQKDVKKMKGLKDWLGIPILIKKTIHRRGSTDLKFIHLPHMVMYYKQMEYLRNGRSPLLARQKAILELNYYLKLDLGPFDFI